ncbi:MAG: hypothetical protein V4819_26450 [Verrucomicrobiota bacterium]
MKTEITTNSEQASQNPKPSTEGMNNSTADATPAPTGAGATTDVRDEKLEMGTGRYGFFPRDP